MLPVFPGQKHWYQVKSLYMISQKIKFVCTNIADTAIGMESKLVFGIKISLLWAWYQHTSLYWYIDISLYSGSSGVGGRDTSK